MKSLKYFFGMLLITSVVVLGSCKKDKPDEPDFTADYPEAPAVAGKITIFAKFLTEPCNDVVLAGSHVMKADLSDWDVSDVSKLGKFVSAGTIDGKDWGAEGWWKITVDITATAAIPSHNAILGIKPVQLESGKFDWMFQIGDENTVEVKSGDVDVQPGYPGECNLYVATNATAAIIFKSWKNDACNVVRRNYTFNVTVPEGTPENADIYIAGDMNEWSLDATKLTKSGDKKYSVTLNNVMEGAGYKYLMNATWDNEELGAAVEGENCAEQISGNRTTGSSTTINDEVKNFRRITIDKCGDGTYPDVSTVAGKITIFAKFETDLCGEVGFVGTNNGWSDDPDNLPRFIPARVIEGKDWGAAGWWEITLDLDDDSAFSWGEKGSGVISGKPVQLTEDGIFAWAHQIGYDEEGDVETLAGGVEVWDNENGECDLLFRTNVTAVFIFHKWKNDPCVSVPKHNITFSVTVPESTPSDGVIRIVGGFGSSGYPDWKEAGEGMEMTKGADGKYSITLNLKEGETGYKYVLNGSWDNEEQSATCGGVGDRKIEVTGAATENNIVANWKGIGDCFTSTVPAGNGTFIVTITSEVEEDAEIIFTGNFADKAWGDSDRVMTLSDGKYTWTGAYPENFVCKVIKRIGEDVTWASGDNQRFDGENFEFEFSFPE